MAEKLNMLTPEVLKTLQVGDLLECGTMFPGMTKQSVTWLVSHVSSKGVVLFKAFFFGAYVATFAAKPRKDGSVLWHRDWSDA